MQKSIHPNDHMAAGDNSRRMLDTNKGIRNIAPRARLYEELKHTLQDIIDVLTPHCGPNSKYAMVITGPGNGSFEPNIFTKDGIRTMEYVEYASPIQAYVKNIITYIGNRVNNIAKDGTTTAMLLSSQYLLNALSCAELDELNLTTVARGKAYKELEKELLNGIENSKYTKEKLLHLIEHRLSDKTDIEKEMIVGGLVAYMQTLSSSGGNHQLAECIQEMFTNTHPYTWPYLRISQSVIEKDHPFEIKYRECDYRLRSTLVTDSLRNVDLNRKYVARDVAIFAYPDMIERGLTILDKVMNLVMNFNDEQPLMIIAKSVSSDIINNLTVINSKRRFPISLITVQDQSNLSSSDWDIIALLAMTNTPNMANEVTDITEEHLFNASMVEYQDNKLFVHGIVPKSESNLHPYYVYPEASQIYTDFRKELELVIERSKKGHEKNNAAIHKATEILLQLVSPKAPMFLVAGSTHENLANVTVVEDAIGATISSLENGFFINGTLTILEIVFSQLTKYSFESDDGPSTTKYKHQLAKCIDSAITTIVTNLYTTPSMDILPSSGHFFESDQYMNCLDDDGIRRNFENFLVKLLQCEHDVDNHVYPVLQPVDIYKELFARIGELIIRVLSTDKIIVPGGAFVTYGESNKE